MLKIPNLISRSLALWACCLLGSILPAAAQITWNFTTDTPSSGIPTNLTVSALTQGNNNGITTLLSSTSPSSTYPGFSAGNNAAAAARTGALVTDAGGSAYFEVTLTPEAGFGVNFTGIAFGSRSTGTGPTAYTVRTSADGFVSDVATGTMPATSTWGARSSTGFLVNSAAPLTLRIYGHSGVGSPAANTANFRIDDLVLTVDVVTAGGTPPTVASFSPASGFPGDTVTINGSVFGASPTVRFNSTVATGTAVNEAGTQITTTVPAGASTGLIQVSTSGGSATSATPFTVLALPALELLTDATFVVENGTLTGTVRRPADAPSLNLPLTVNLNSANPAKATITSSVIIPANDLFTSFTITGVPDNVFGPTVNVTFTASATGFTNGTASVAVTNVDPAPVTVPTVVINKILNGTPELVELLVVGNGTSGTTLDMQGMILKDYSSNIANDGGGKRTFATTSLWAAVPVGTLIVISTESNTSTDLDPSDFLLRVGLGDTTLFTGISGTFNMAGTEMVIIKASGSAEANEAGAIHALAYGALGTPPGDPNTLFARYGNTAAYKNFANGTNSAIVQNPNATLADFNGGPATTSAALATADFGKANNPSNNAFIRSLRGITSLSGVGTASLLNDTAASPFLGRNIFDRGVSGQRAAISLLSDVNPGTLTRASIVVPAALGIPLPANVSVTGAGAGTPVVSITGQTINLSGLDVTTVNPAIVTIGGLTTPSPTGITADGRYEFAVNTAGPSGSLAAIAVSPSAVVIIPVESLKDVDSLTGVPTDLNKVVAVSGVVTEENFNNAQLSGFIQDGDFGMNIFSFNTAIATLVRGNRYVITGTVVQFAGLTEIVPASAGDVIDLGAGTPPVPLVVTPLEISAPLDAQALENLEGRLIKVRGLSSVSGTWADPTPPATPTSNNFNDVILKDAGGNNITIRIAAATSANTPPTRYPASITGILSQAAATPTNLFTGYILMPRDPADLELDPIVSGYSTWAAAYPGIGSPENDADGDGQSNYLEYALGTVPDNRTSVQPMVLSNSGGQPALSIAKGAAASADPDVFYQIQGSPDLTNWATSTSPDTPLDEVTNTSETLTVRYLGTSAKYYFRLKVGPPPP